MLFIFLWFIIANTILEQHGHQAGVAGQIWALIVAIFLARMARSLVLPFVGIAAKWLVVGRYKEGRYKLWGAAYLRWWMVDKVGSVGCYSSTVVVINRFNNGPLAAAGCCGKGSICLDILDKVPTCGVLEAHKAQHCG